MVKASGSLWCFFSFIGCTLASALYAFMAGVRLGLDLGLHGHADISA